MNKYLKSFLHRGLIFGGFGPIIAGIIYAILEHTLPDFSLSGTQVCMAIVTTYLLAFTQAGVSVFNQIEEWALPKSLFFHFSVTYIAYTLCYLLNSWIPFKTEILLIFTAIFVIGYFAIWLTVYLIVKATSRKMNRMLG